MLSDPIIVPDLVKAVNALSETAAAWNHDIIDRLIIIQLYDVVPFWFTLSAG
jgi:hypothetical protein